MTLTTHAIVGAAIVSIFSARPEIGIPLAFASHFVMDAIPHWSYSVLSDSMNPSGSGKMVFDKLFMLDVLRIGTDAVLGIALSIFFFANMHDYVLIALGAMTAILPDALQFVYSKFKHQPLIALQKFHVWVHMGHKIDNPVIGIFSQILIITFVVLIGRHF